MASTDRHDESPASSDCVPSIPGDDGSGPFCGRLRVDNHVKRHSTVSGSWPENGLQSKFLLLRLLQMSTKLKTHCRKQFVGVITLAARTKSLVKRSFKDWRRNRFVDRGLDGPATFA